MKKRLLLVEKDDGIAEIVQFILEDEGYEVIVSRTEYGMIEKISKDKPDLILLDIMKPTDEGTALCKEIKKLPATKHIPVIVLSTFPKIQSANIGCADDIIAKPFDVAEMVSVIEEHLSASPVS